MKRSIVCAVTAIAVGWLTLAAARAAVLNVPGDYATIQAAINAAAAGDTIAVAAGEYDHGPIALNKAVTLEGPNAGRSGGDAGRGPEARIVNSQITVTAAAVLDGFEVFQTNNTADAVLVQAAATIRNTVIRRMGVTTGVVARGITTAVGTHGFNIERNLFTGDPGGGFFSGHKTWNSGLWLNGGAGRVADNVFENCRTAINADDFNAGLELTGNTFRTSGTYLAFGGTTPTDGQFTIAGNEFFLDWADPVTNWLPSAMFNLSNVAATFRVNAMGNTFGGVATADLSANQKFQIEARNYHRGRSGRNGVVDFVAGEQIVMPGTTFQSAVNAAAAGETVRVGPGVFAENVTTTVPLEIVGVGDSTVVAPPAGGTAIALAAGTDASHRSVLRNLRLQGAGTGITAGSFTTLEGVTSTGHSSYGINLASGQDLIITGCHFDGNAVGLKLSSGASFSHLTISDSSFDNNTQHGWYSDANSSVKPDLDHITITATSFSGNGLKGFYTERLSNAVFDNLTVRDNANSAAYAWGAGLDVNLKWKAYSGVTIRNSSFVNNGRGSANGVALTIKARDDGATYGALPATLDGVTVTGCDFDSNERDIYFGEPAKNNAGPTGVVVSRCRFPNPAVAALLNHSQAVVDGERNYWGHATGPTHTSNPGGSGSAVGDGVPYSPWYADEALTILVTAANFEDHEIPAGASEVVDDLYIGAGATYVVRGTLEVTGKLVLEDGATIEVMDGELVLGTAGGGTHTMAGTFVVYNSFGSIEILEDTEFSGDALMLISDIHVADGVTLTVSGSLILDGCAVDCLDAGGRFAIEVVSGGTLTMERTQLFDADLTLSGNGSLVRNNQLTNVAVAVTAGAADNAVYHNVFLGTTALTDAGTGTVATLDGWGNVASLSETHNDLALALTLTGLGPNRTLDAAGNLYVQPGDLVQLRMNVAKLLDKIQGVEAMLGFNNDYFDPSLPSSLGGVAPWIYELHNVWATDGVYGKIDTAIGLDFDYPDREGTSSDGTVAAIALQTRAREGVTQVYFRPRLVGDHVEAKTALTVNPTGINPSYRMPFTLNTGYITVDGTDPQIDNFTATQTQESGAVDVFDPAAITHQGTVAFTVDATDALAGIDDADAVLEIALRGNPGVTLAATLAGKTAVEIGGVTWTRYTFTAEIVAATPNGTYDAVVKVLDRSGNVSDELAGAFTVQKNQVSVTVQLQGGAAGPLTRDIVFTAANATLGELKVWTKTVSFTDGVGVVTLLEAPDGMAFLDAKTEWTLRVRVACAPNGDGQSVADFTGANQLPGGDLNGDNRVNMLDYSILRYFWFTTEAQADITGNGSVDLFDFNILKSNWYGIGAPAAGVGF